jgi:hypothetical protein
MAPRQLHLRLTDAEYDYVVQLAKESEESINTALRRLIRAHMRASKEGHRVAETWTTLVPRLLRSTEH